MVHILSGTGSLVPLQEDDLVPFFLQISQYSLGQLQRYSCMVTSIELLTVEHMDVQTKVTRQVAKSPFNLIFAPASRKMLCFM
jgi:hypothetical protein